MSILSKAVAAVSLLFSITIFAYTHTVEMQGMKFVPDITKAKVGDTIEFTNKTNMLHNVVSQNPKIRSPFLKKDEKFKLKIEKKGKIEYYCEPHRTGGMKGVVESD